jgi:hypothetical protein
MKQGMGKITDVRTLLLDLDDLSDSEVAELGRKEYSDLFLTMAKRGIHDLHDGEKVVFFAERYDHAFFISPTKVNIERGRVARIRWILPLMQGKVPNSQCWLKPKLRGDQRFYVCNGLRYIVWLEPRTVGGWRFSSAYNAEQDEIEYYKKGATLLCCFK